MRVRPGYVLLFLGLAAVFGFFAWAFYATSGLGSWTGGSATIATMIVAGVVGTGALTGVLMWLAFYSSRKGFDESPKWEDRD